MVVLREEFDFIHVKKGKQYHAELKDGWYLISWMDEKEGYCCTNYTVNDVQDNINSGVWRVVANKE